MTFHFFENDTGFINKLLDVLSVIDLIAGAKVIRFAGRAAQVEANKGLIISLC